MVIIKRTPENWNRIVGITKFIVATIISCGLIYFFFIEPLYEAHILRQYGRVTTAKIQQSSMNIHHGRRARIMIDYSYTFEFNDTYVKKDLPIDLRGYSLIDIIYFPEKPSIMTVLGTNNNYWALFLRVSGRSTLGIIIYFLACCCLLFFGVYNLIERGIKGNE